MEMIAKLAKKYRLARLCRIGVWIVVIAGAAQIVSNVYFIWANYRQIQITQSLNPGLNDQFNQISYSPAYIFFQSASPILQTVVFYVFYGIVLYAASVIFTAISAQPATASATSQPGSTLELDDSAGSEEDPDRIVYTSLKREDIARDRQQINNHKSAGHRS